jgi:penicillin-binding protein-related factor A (putative recombinase)
MSKQFKLEGVGAAHSHAHLGKEFEAMLDRAHDLYNRTRRAWVYKIPNAWTFIGAREYEARPTQRRALQQDAGKTRFLGRISTPFDYAGHVAAGSGAPAPFYCDAKQFDGTAIPLKEFKPHQLDNLANAAQAGKPGAVLAGFLVWSKQANRVYWLDALKAREMADRATHAPKGRAKGVIKSLSVAWLEEHAAFLCETDFRGADYLPALTKYWRGE